MIGEKYLVLECGIPDLTRYGYKKLQAIAKSGGTDSFWVSMNNVSIDDDRILFIDGLGGIVLGQDAEYVSDATLKGVKFKRENGRWGMFLYTVPSSVLLYSHA